MERFCIMGRMFTYALCVYRVVCLCYVVRYLSITYGGNRFVRGMCGGGITQVVVVFLHFFGSLEKFVRYWRHCNTDEKTQE